MKITVASRICRTQEKVLFFFLLFACQIKKKSQHKIDLKHLLTTEKLLRCQVSWMCQTCHVYCERRTSIFRRFKLQLSLLNRLFHHLCQVLLQRSSKVLSRGHLLGVQVDPGGERVKLRLCGQVDWSLRERGNTGEAKCHILGSLKEERFSPAIGGMFITPVERPASGAEPGDSGHLP